MSLTDKIKTISPFHVASKVEIEKHKTDEIKRERILVPSDHEGIKVYISLAQVENDYDVSTNVWKQAHVYFASNPAGQLQVVLFNQNYSATSNEQGGNTGKPNMKMNPDGSAEKIGAGNKEG